MRFWIVCRGLFLFRAFRFSVFIRFSFFRILLHFLWLLFSLTRIVFYFQCFQSISNFITSQHELDSHVCLWLKFKRISTIVPCGSRSSSCRRSIKIREDSLPRCDVINWELCGVKKYQLWISCVNVFLCLAFHTHHSFFL